MNHTQPAGLASFNRVRPSDSKYTQDVVIRIGNQVRTLVNDSALSIANDEITRVIQHIIALGVSSVRGVELVTQAFFSNRLGDEPRIAKAIEAVLWEKSAQGNWPEGQVAIQPVARELARRVGKIPFIAVDAGKVEIVLKAYITDLNSPTKGNPEPVVKIDMLVLEENFYRSVRNDDEVVVSREYGIHPTSEMPMQGVWVMRNYHTGEFIDSDKYLNDLAERNNLKIN